MVESFVYVFTCPLLCYNNSPSKTSAIAFSFALLGDSDSLCKTTAAFLKCVVVPKCFVFLILFSLFLLLSVTCLKNCVAWLCTPGRPTLSLRRQCRCSCALPKGVVLVGTRLSFTVSSQLVGIVTFPLTTCSTCSSFYTFLSQSCLDWNLAATSFNDARLLENSAVLVFGFCFCFGSCFSCWYSCPTPEARIIFLSCAPEERISFFLAISFFPAPEIRMIFLSGTGSKNHLLVRRRK